MLFPHLRGLRVGQVEDTGDAVVIRACCRAAQAQCPACGAVSSRVHGGYARVPDGSLDVCGRERQLATRTRERYAEIRERLGAGQPQAAIRRATGLDRRTVQRYARATSAGELLASMSRESKLEKFKPYICQRWNQGLTDAAQIHAELQQRGWAGSPQTVRRYVHLLRQAGPAVTPAPAVPKPARSPAGCRHAPAASTTATRPGSPRSGPAALTWTPWPGTSGTSPA